MKKAVSNTANTVSKSAVKLQKQLMDCFTAENMVGCLVGLFAFVYIVMLNNLTALDFFSSVMGKVVSLLVLLMALTVDVKLGVFVAVAVVLSIVFASMNGVVESYAHEDFSENLDQGEVVPNEDDGATENAPVGSTETEDEMAEESYDNYSPVDF